MSPKSAAAATIVACLLVGACGDDDAGGPAADGGGGREAGLAGDAGPGLRNVRSSHPAAAPIAPATECTVTTAEASDTGPRDHVPSCSLLAYPHLPPTGGPHYGLWADYTEYDRPVPWGFLVHAMEHGGVVLAYDCPEGCPEVLAELRAIAAETSDPLCAPDGGVAGRNRIIVVPAPDLDVPLAAAAWGFQYEATCLDPASLRAFVTEHYGRAPEDLCAPGSDLSTFCDTDGGLPPDAGMHDRDAGLPDPLRPDAGGDASAASGDAGSAGDDAGAPEGGA